MAILFSVLGMAIAALCVWLTVRIINRRERWSKRTLAAVVGVPMLYIMSFGPACWFGQRRMLSARTVYLGYRPVVAAMHDGPEPIKRVLHSFAGFSSGEPFAGFSSGELDSIVFRVELLMEIYSHD
jgi:hypothetical protein